VNSLVPCDLCDHSQISHIVSNDVRSDILLTTLHVILIGQSVITCKVVSKMSLVTSLLTTSQICE
ncbi:unnamed protein product, partial [Staurois parvus]